MRDYRRAGMKLSSEEREGGERNICMLTKMLELRARAADLLGHAHSADFQTEILMTRNADTVAEF